MRSILYWIVSLAPLGLFAQTPFSVFDCSYSNPAVTQSEIESQQEYYKQCVLFGEDEVFDFDQNDDNVVKALNYIHIKKDFHAGSYNPQGQMHLVLEEKSDLDVYSMNQPDLSQIPVFDKFELGLDLPFHIDQSVNDFVNGIGSGNELNPFDPDDIDIRAEFSYLLEGNWIGPQTIFGFYYEEYQRMGTSWENQYNPIDYRIRFTPRLVGTWKCAVKVFVSGSLMFESNEFLFDVIHSGYKDFTRVGQNNRYLKIGNDPFFPIGQNLPWPRVSAGEWTDEMSLSPEYVEFHNELETLKNAGGNYFRTLLNPWNFGLEFEELNNYSARMTNAWELDEMLDVARTNELRIHLNLHVHYPFEKVNPYAFRYWDWASAGSGAYNSDCVLLDDEGNAYSLELGLQNPKDFFESNYARDIYKKRLRYIIARWGYSTEIGVFELFSEINNAGVHADLQLGSGGCSSDQSLSTPYAEDPNMPSIIYDWQNEMCRYIKEDLGHFQHPLAVNYTGTPVSLYSGVVDASTLLTSGCNIQDGDFSYYSDYVDIWTWNYYKLSPEKYSDLVEILYDLNPNDGISSGNPYVTIPGVNYPQQLPLAINKPLILSEIGPGDGSWYCDNDISYKKSLLISPFTGCAGSGMSWDWSNQVPYINDLSRRNNLWQLIGRVKDYFEGIDFDGENWIHGMDVRSDKKADMFYLKDQSNGHRKAMGVLHNRTVNFWSGRDQSLDIDGAGDESDCKTAGIVLDSPYNYAQTVQPSNSSTPFVNWGYNNDNKLKIKGMGPFKKYSIKFYNPNTDDFQTAVTETANAFGRLNIKNILLDQFDYSIYYFKVYKFGDSEFIEEITTENEDYSFLLRGFNMKNDVIDNVGMGDKFNNESLLDLKQEKDPWILLNPNPTDGLFNISYGNVDDEVILHIISMEGKIVFEEDNPFVNMAIELKNYHPGVYNVVLHGGTTLLRTKLVIK